MAVFDITGQKFNRWTILQLVSAGSNQKTVWLCRCECGTERNVRSDQVLGGTSKSCGCLKLERLKARSIGPKWKKSRTRDSFYWWHIKHKYGLSKEEYRAMEQAQNGKCAICSCLPKLRLYVDHNHATGKVRGLLCNQCNAMLGQIRDCPERMRMAIQYLQRTT